MNRAVPRALLLLLLLLAPLHASAQASALGAPITSDTAIPTPPSGTLVPPPHGASTEPSDATLEENLDAWLVHYADAARTPRILGGVVGVVGGALVIGAASVGLAIWDPRGTTGSILIGEEGLLLGLGAIDLALGIYQLAVVSLQEARLERWRAARARGPVSAIELGRFQGEIRGEVMMAEQARGVSLALGIGVAVGGLVGLGMTAGYAHSSTGEIIGYGGSSLAIVLGVLLAILPWLDTTPEDDWRRIEAGEGPRLTSVTPWGSATGGGWMLNGTF